MPNKLPEVYEGDLDYIFVSYARADKEEVLPIVHTLVDEGYRVWYDGGIELATNYLSSIEGHVDGCAVFMMFVSHNFNASRSCYQESSYARHLNKTVLPIYLEDVEPGRGLRMWLVTNQSIRRAAFPSWNEFCHKLLGASVLRTCLASKDGPYIVPHRTALAEYS